MTSTIRYVSYHIKL